MRIKRLTLVGVPFLAVLMAGAWLSGPIAHALGDTVEVGTPAVMQIEVLNASQHSRLARRVTRMLREHGLDVVYFGNASTQLDTTRVVVRRGAPAAAARVQQALGFGVVTVEPDSLRLVDVTILLGADAPSIPTFYP